MVVNEEMNELMHLLKDIKYDHNQSMFQNDYSIIDPLNYDKNQILMQFVKPEE